MDKKSIGNAETNIFGEAVKVGRCEKKISQDRLSDVTGVSRNSISNIELGDSDPKLSTAIVISSALDISIDELFELKGCKEGLSSDEFKLLHTFKRMSSAHKSELLKIAEVFKVSESQQL